MAAKLVLALAMGATALLAPSNKLPVNTVRRAASAAPEMVVKVGAIGAGRSGLVHLEALRAAASWRHITTWTPGRGVALSGRRKVEAVARRWRHGGVEIAWRSSRASE